MKVVLDIDGVFADFDLAITKLGCDKIRSTIVPESDVDQVAYSKYSNMTPTESGRAWALIHEDPNFWLHVPPNPAIDPETIEYLNELALFHDFYFVTARPEVTAVKRNTETWLKDYGVRNPTVIMSRWKGEIAQAIDAEFMIDDKHSNASFAIWHTRKRCQGYVLDRPYNRVDGGSSKVKRVSNVIEFLREVNGYAIHYQG